MLTCRDVLDNLSGYLDGEGNTELRQALEEHIARCRRCRVMLGTTRKTLKIVVDIEPFEVPLAVSARLYAKLAKVLAED